ncbi:AAA family ATPase, partial [Enterobacter cloacae]|nr:AAA family ATPase [Enterobacter cloacae]
SMGMRQRLGLAAALLGDPRLLVLDEPSNGLDPEGIRWLRGFLRHLASEGRTILVSSHLLQEIEQTVDDVVILANGKLVKEGTVG